MFLRPDATRRAQSSALTFNDLTDVEAFRHLKRNRVLDGITRKAVNDKSTLATLYEYDDPAVDNTLVQNLICIANPKVPCQVEIVGGKLFPPTIAGGEHGYKLYLTYNKLVSTSDERHD